MQYGYCRVSTYSQKDNTSLQEQERAILALYPNAKIVTEVFSGVKKRKQFDELIHQLQPGDLVVCTKMDRFCRNAREGLDYVDEILEAGASFHILNMGLADNSATGKIIVMMFLAFAEFEHDMIVQRTKEGREAARLRPGYRDGRKLKFSKAQLDHAVELLSEHSYKEVEEMTGISVSTIQRHRRKLEAKEKASQT